MSKTVLKLAEGRRQKAESAGTKEVKSSKKRAIEDVEVTPISVTNQKKVKLSTNLRPVDDKNQSVEVIAQQNETNEGKVIYLGHIPDGFFEKQMRKFFKQYGDVSKIKLFRSQKTNKSKGYAFIEFASAEVAGIVAESMNGYFLMERKLVCHVVPADKLHEGIFAQPKPKERKRRHSFDESDEEGEGKEMGVNESNFARVAGLHIKSMTKKQAKLSEMGIEYEIPFAKPLDSRVQPEQKLNEKPTKKNKKTSK